MLGLPDESSYAETAVIFKWQREDELFSFAWKIKICKIIIFKGEEV